MPRGKRYIHERTTAEIAVEPGVKMDNVRMVLSRARGNIYISIQEQFNSKKGSD